MRQIYTFLFYAAVPFLLVRLLWKGLGQPGYLDRIRERFGFYESPEVPDSIWLHAVSVGECEAAFPIINRLLQQSTQARLVVTCTTPTGSARIREVLGDKVLHVYLPYDLPDAVNRFLNHFNPQLGVIMETEIWPNLFLTARRKQIPLTVVNARLSEKSARGYTHLSGLVSDSLEAVAHIAAQSEQDATRYRSIGADPARISVTGNIKFEIEFDTDMKESASVLRTRLFWDRPVWIAGSTHPGEEAILLDAFAAVRKTLPNLLLVIAPRHPERSQQIRVLCEGRGLKVHSRSTGTPPESDTSVFLIDGIGELRKFYGTADIAFIGGSLVPHGGQNPLEAASAGIPVLFGPHMSNFAEISRNLLAAGAGFQIEDVGTMTLKISELLQQPDLSRTIGKKGEAFVKSNRGALDRVMAIIDSLKYN